MTAAQRRERAMAALHAQGYSQLAEAIRDRIRALAHEPAALNALTAQAEDTAHAVGIFEGRRYE